MKKVIATSVALVLLAGCGIGKRDADIVVSSPDFKGGEVLPKPFTCDGSNISPELMWSKIPVKTQSFTIMATDPNAPEKEFTHWILFNLPPRLTKIDQALSEEKISELGALQGTNDFGKLGYVGACPPQGEKPHHYLFTLYALDTKLNLKSGVSREEVLKAMEGHIIGKGELSATYMRHDK